MRESESGQSEWVIEGLVQRRKADGRAVYSAAGKRALVALCVRPGVSLARAALVNGVNANLVRKWMLPKVGKRAVRANPAQPSAALVPVQVKSAQASAQSGDLSCELVLPKAVLRVQTSEAGLARLIELLS